MSLGDVQRLRAFALVLDLGSISAAASVLGYTQSAVSQQLAALEREVGAALVDRSQRPLRATRAGAAPAPARRAACSPRSAAPRPRWRTSAAARPPAPRRLHERAVVVRAGGGARPAPRAPASSSSRCSSSRRDEAVERLRGGDADLAVVHHMPGRRGARDRRPASGAACSSTTSTWCSPRATGSRGATR